MRNKLAIAALAGLGPASTAFADSPNLTGIMDGQTPISLTGGLDAEFSNVPNGSDWTTVKSGMIQDAFGVSTAEIPVNMTNYLGGANCSNCGADVTGEFVPAVTGYYQFAMASDDSGAVFLSTDSTAANEVNIISQIGGWVGSRNYNEENGGDGPNGNFSSLILLRAGQSYYFEGIHGQVGGGNNFAVTANYIVPEPASLGLIGLCGAGLLRRRVRKA